MRDAVRPGLFAITLGLSLTASAEPGIGGAWDYQFVLGDENWLTTSSTRISFVNQRLAPSDGYTPLELSIDNSRGPAGNVRLVLEALHGPGHRVERTIAIAAGERGTAVLPFPTSLSGGSLYAVAPTGERSNRQGVYTTSGDDERPSLLVIGEPSSFEWLVGRRPASEWKREQVRVSVLGSKEAPADLASYVGYDAVAIVDREAAAAVDEAQRRALEAYALTGGVVVLAPGTGFDELFSEEPGSAVVSRADVRFGLGAVHRTVAGRVPPAFRSKRALLVTPRGDATDLRSREGSTEANHALLEEASPPVGTFSLVMFAFTLVIGPGSYLVAKRRGVMMPLVTIPLTALVACVAIVATAVLRDGFAIRASVYGYTLLDGARHRAITVGAAALYANLAPREARFDRFAVPIAARDADGLEWQIDWTDGARLGSSFLPSRTYREWGFLSVQPTRARLVVRKEGTQRLLQNALGLPVTAVWVRLGSELLRAEELPDGGERSLELLHQLTPNRKQAQPGWLGRSTLPTEADPLFERTLARRFVEPLEDGEFLAIVAGTAFVPTGGLDLELRDARSIVRGRVSE